MRDQGGSGEVLSYLVQQVEHCGHRLDVSNVEKHDTREIGCFRDGVIICAFTYFMNSEQNRLPRSLLGIQ